MQNAKLHYSQQSLLSIKKKSQSITGLPSTLFLFSSSIIAGYLASEMLSLAIIIANVKPFRLML